MSLIESNMKYFLILLFNSQIFVQEVSSYRRNTNYYENQDRKYPTVIGTYTKPSFSRSFIDSRQEKYPPSKIQQVLRSIKSEAEYDRKVEQACQTQERIPKVQLLQNDPKSFQYIELVTKIPILDQFHFCLWLKSYNFSTEHPIFSYAVPQNPSMVSMWISSITSNEPGFHLVINGLKVFDLYHPIKTNVWNHICQSWKGDTGQWILFLNGISIGDGFGPQKLIGLKIPGDGKSVIGQQLDTFLLHSPFTINHRIKPTGILPLQKQHKKHFQGIQGEITLFEMKSEALAIGSKGLKIVKKFQIDCFEKIQNNPIIEWRKVHLKLYGGAEIYNVQPICASFPE